MPFVSASIPGSLSLLIRQASFASRSSQYHHMKSFFFFALTTTANYHFLMMLRLFELFLPAGIRVFLCCEPTAEKTETCRSNSIISTQLLGLISRQMFCFLFFSLHSFDNWFTHTTRSQIWNTRRETGVIFEWINLKWPCCTLHEQTVIHYLFSFFPLQWNVTLKPDRERQ